MRISVFGLGYVGAVSCGCLAELGHTVVGVDVAEAKVALINNGTSPILEDDLPDLLARAHRGGLLSATVDPASAVAASDAALICVGTPSTPSGGTDDQYLAKVVMQIAAAVKEAKSAHSVYTVIVRSTCLPQVHRKMQDLLVEYSKRRMGHGVSYVCHPEFLREGAAVRDFFEPPKIVFGCSDDQAQSVCRQLYPGIEAPTFFVNPETAAMVKYADNCFHAVKVTFGNEIGMLCHQLHVNARDVMSVFCQDMKLNISPKYLIPGAPFGGSCLPKDLRAVLDAARQEALPLTLLAASLTSNDIQLREILSRILGPSRPAIGVVGLAFKEGTDDVRESPMVAIVEHLCGKGHLVHIYDGNLSLQRLTGGNLSFALQKIPHLSDLVCDSLSTVVDASEVILVSHRLNPRDWERVQLPDDKRILDLVGVDALQSHPGYEGLFW